MEACLSVEKEVEKVLNKFGAIKDHGNRTLGDLIAYISGLKAELEQAPENHEITTAQIIILNQAMSKVKETVSRLATEHRDLHSTVSKVGKTIDRNFVSDYASVTNEQAFSEPEKSALINQVICEHFYRQGMMDIGETLAKEAGLDIESRGKGPFEELNSILDALKQKNLEPALAWTVQHRQPLQEQNSNLEFKLHRLSFIRLVSEGKSRQAEAVMYAKTHFPRFVADHEKEIQVLMGMLLYISTGLGESPYKRWLDPLLWTEICETFTRDACTLLGLSAESPLTVCISDILTHFVFFYRSHAVNVGAVALPALLNIKQVMMQRQVTGMWSNKDELPIEIDVGKDYRFHSIFACPILRQQSSEANPPMRLVCGHVISRDALTKLSTGNKRTMVSLGRLKCPYCPVEQNPNNARQVYF